MSDEKPKCEHGNTEGHPDWTVPLDADDDPIWCLGPVIVACNIGESANNCSVHKAPWRTGQPFCDNATSSNWIADDVIAN